MRQFLLATLYAPLASWGDIAVGELRGSWDRPSRSAILGLVAASLGLEREDQGAHDALDFGYGFAVRLDAPGVPLSDYHTAQTISATAMKRRRATTRAQMLAANDRETILSRRMYRQDAVATALLWGRAGARWTLEQIADALRKPKYVLYAGRKANALGLPVSPEIVEATTLAEAFGKRPAIPAELEVFTRHAFRRALASAPEISHDRCDGFASGLQHLRRETRRDAGAHRIRWQFAERTVEVGVIASTKEEWLV